MKPIKVVSYIYALPTIAAKHYIQMDKKVAKILDSLIPRGGTAPHVIHVSFEDYLSRLSNLYRKLEGVEYRMKRWNTVCEDHKKNFDKMAEFRESMKFPDGRKIDRLSESLRDIKVENEFEMLLYSISSTLSALTRVVACFLKGSPDFHSHSRLPSLLLKHQGLNKSQSIVANACESWAKELTERRDAATHYLAVSIESSVVHSKSDSFRTKKEVKRIGLTKKPVKFVSLWEDILPTFGGSTHTGISLYDEKADTKQEIHELHDAQKRIIIRRESPLPRMPELIDGEKYVQGLYKHFNHYVIALLSSLKPALRTKSS